jgi:hypothetical protein
MFTFLLEVVLANFVFPVIGIVLLGMIVLPVFHYLFWNDMIPDEE